jgi:diacylglycerol kinase (ATP)
VRHGALIYNPAAGRGRHEKTIDAIVTACRRADLELAPVPTTGPGQATELAGELAREHRIEAVFALGGDGTAREVAAGLLGTSTHLGILPGGTVNLMALALGLPRDPVAAAALLCGLAPRPVDVGMAGMSAFLMMTSAGLDARALSTLDRDFKSRLGRTAVLLQGVREWWRYAYPDLEIEADGRRLAPATFLTVSNIPYYGGNFRMAPRARPDSRKFELVVFRGRGRAATLGFILDVVRGRHIARADVAVQEVSEVVFSVPPGSAMQVDGDPVGEGESVHVRLAPQRLLVLAPGGEAPAAGFG